jgi:hypothetical protein
LETSNKTVGDAEGDAPIGETISVAKENTETHLEAPDLAPGTNVSSFRKETLQKAGLTAETEFITVRV